ncbi:hypothetical protein BASA50_009394 [Batrachochytrium salamandrivorans]|uniref:Uncharacterized protein n=1 Tax=Batrachochytrium salamandrivorans TaxID=1357716 RepID=A0ABQ8F2M0_9FUNG|nr:hypothetical protein BASA62_005460 [Batrachochytrium salamandrivorans]KAH6577347.1 hypothetical protein BASA60_004088 [Batrachochytrium salamandrivorans]KAH6590419.1 hypothetical protein BASA50_009394 [Batrachochytrium salamandrivorans]KAH9247435.1 hypothetical protein BASA81_014971 [Batrachochytrium salamandrivorans]KAH9273209.1 hypothetical protein BASA83_004498 [Batrachochytrium salamandrivorans]
MNSYSGALLINSIDSLPWFIVKQIYQYAGPLTRYLHNQLPQPITESALRLIMVDCFKQNNATKTMLILAHYPKYIPIWESLFIFTSSIESVLELSGRVNTPIWTAKCLQQGQDGALNQFEKLIAQMDAETEFLAKEAFDMVVQSLSQSYSQYFESYILSMACSLGRLDVAKELVGGAPHLREHCLRAIKSNQSNIVELLIDSGKDVTAQLAFNAAVSYGRTELVDILRHKYSNLQIRPEDITCTMLYGHINVVWLLAQDTKLSKFKGFRSLRRLADALGHQDLRDFAKTHNIGSDEVIDRMSFDMVPCSFDTAAKLLGGISGFNSRHMLSAAQVGQVDFIAHLLECWGELPLIRSDTCKLALETASQYCHYAVVKLLVERGLGICQNDIDNALISAARNGHLSIFSYLYHITADHVVHAEAIREAVACHHVDLVEYFMLHEGNVDKIIMSLLTQGYNDVVDAVLSL